MIRKAARHGAISKRDADYLVAMAEASIPASSTMALIVQKGAPDFLYAALYFSTMIWQLGEAVGCEAHAQAGYELAQFALSQESPAHDSYWAAKLLREFYDAHNESSQHAVVASA